MNLLSQALTTSIDGRGSLEKDFNELIYMNLYIILYITIDQVDLFHGYI